MQVELLKKSGSMQEARLTAATADAASQSVVRQRLQEVHTNNLFTPTLYARQVSSTGPWRLHHLAYYKDCIAH